MRPPSLKAVYKTTSIPAPVGGLNALDSIANMPPTDAPVMENFFPQTTSVDIRNGSLIWQQDNTINAYFETLMPYNGLNNKKLFGCAGSKIYDVTMKSGSPSPSVTGLSNARWQYTNVGTAGGQYLYAVNGIDSPQLFNGSTWQAVTNGSSPIALTGVDPTTLVNVTLHKQRLWFIQKNTCVVWYLNAGSIGGTLLELDMTQLFKLGGTLVAMMTFTLDNVSGITELAAFITSEGEVLLYDGTDPNSSSTWNLVASFRIGRPVGYKCFERVAGDLMLITTDGIYPLSKALMEDRDRPRDAISAKIYNLLNNDVASYNGNYGWQACLHPLGNKLIVNVPMVESSSQYQYVMNTITNAWTKFTGWNAACWAVQEDILYYGGLNTVYQADTGTDDVGSNITAICKPAFNYFDTLGQNKMWTMVRPIFSTTGNISPVISLNIDFNDVRPSSTATYTSTGTPWDTSSWDTSPWSSNNITQSNWESVGGIGKAGTIYLKISSQGQAIQWQATDWVYQMGGVL